MEAMTRYELPLRGLINVEPVGEIGSLLRAEIYEGNDLISMKCGLLYGLAKFSQRTAVDTGDLMVSVTLAASREDIDTILEQVKDLLK